MGDEAYWWNSDRGGQLSVLNGTSLITVFTFAVNNPLVIERRRDALEVIATKLLVPGQQNQHRKEHTMSEQPPTRTQAVNSSDPGVRRKPRYVLGTFWMLIGLASLIFASHPRHPGT